MPDLVIRSMFGSMVRNVGGSHAASAILTAARCGSLSTVSKMTNGTMGVTVEAAMALELATGQSHISEYMLQQNGKTAHGSNACILTLTGQAHQEFGEAMTAIATFMQSNSEKGKAQAQAIVEGEEAIAALKKLIENLK